MLNYRDISINGVALPRRPNLNIIGATGADNPVTNATDVTLLEGGTSIYATDLTALEGAIDRARVYCDGRTNRFDGGGGEFVWHDGNSSAADGGTVFGAGTGRWKRVFSGSYNALWFGCVGDGSTDDSDAAQDAIDAAKGGTVWFPPGREYLLAGVTLDGSTYDDTTIIFDGELKLKPNAGGTTFGGQWVGLLVRDCARTRIKLNANGNRAAMTDVENILVLALAGVTDCDVSGFIREVQVDGVYVSTKTWNSNTTNSSRVNIHDLAVINSSEDGRNAVSIISCDDLTMDNILSINVGGLVNGARMPGGVDLEPNQAYESINGFSISNVNVVTAGGAGFGLVGRAATNDAARDWNIQNGKISNVNVRLTTATTGAPTMVRCRSVVGDLKIVRDTDSHGLEIDYADKMQMSVHVDGSTACYIGYDDKVKDSTVNLEIVRYSGVGLGCIGVENTMIRGKISGSSGSNPVAVSFETSRTVTQTNVEYCLDIPYESGMYAGYYKSTANVTHTDCHIRDCDMSSWPDFVASGSASAFRGAQAYPYRRNVVGMHAATIPTYGYWRLGEVVASTAPSEDAGIGWTCTTAGASAAWLVNDKRPTFSTFEPVVTASGGGFALGNGSLLGRLIRHGDMVIFSIRMVGGTGIGGTTWGTGYFEIALPFTLSGNVSYFHGSGMAITAAGVPYIITAVATGTVCRMRVNGTASYVGVAGGIPFAWADGAADEFSITVPCFLAE